MSKPKVLFVCLGNICRSPTAEAVFRHKIKNIGLDIFIDSAGTGGWHHGELPDIRARKAGEQRGYSFAEQTARPIKAEDFKSFDFILAMDKKNLRELKNQAPHNMSDKVHLFLDYGTGLETEVPDPYYGGSHGFENVLNLIEDACDGLINQLQTQI